MTTMAQEVRMNYEESKNSGKRGDNSSRREILEELESMGVETSNFDSLSMEELDELLSNLQNLCRVNAQVGERHRARNANQTPILSEKDKKILRHLLSSDGHVSSLVLSKELDIPLSTAQRRRKRLEVDLIERNYSLRVEKFGWRTATLFISTDGNTSSLGREILENNDSVISATRILGQNGTDLKIDLIFKTNKDLLLVIDHIKSLDGVGNVTWSESVESIGKNRKYCQTIIDQ